MLIQRSRWQKEISVSSSRYESETISGSKVTFTDQKFERTDERVASMELCSGRLFLRKSRTNGWNVMP
jgi:hypothetical protein